MPRPRKAAPRPEDLPTIWEVPDALWERIAPILAEVDPPKPTGRPRIEAPRALEAIIFRLRSGCQWNHLPTELPDDSLVHRTLQRGIALGVPDRIWASLVIRRSLGTANVSKLRVGSRISRIRVSGIGCVRR